VLASSSADAHRRKFDAVLVWKIDRFGRSLKHLVNALADLCAYGVAFASFRDNFDLSTPRKVKKLDRFEKARLAASGCLLRLPFSAASIRAYNPASP
jgi:DNA invertase Pin-like site-specific DNA recombinase